MGKIFKRATTLSFQNFVDINGRKSQIQEKQKILLVQAQEMVQLDAKDLTQSRHQVLVQVQDKDQGKVKVYQTPMKESKPKPPQK